MKTDTDSVIGDQRLDLKMSFINQPQILAEEVNRRVLIGEFGGFLIWAFRDIGCNFTPLPKTWYEEQVDTETTRTIRFAKRSDHTGILFKIDKHAFYDHTE